MRAGVLSEPKVVERISRDFVPFALNVTRDTQWQCAESLPALRHLQNAYTRNWRFAFGFASCIAITSDGQHVLGFMGASGGRRTETDVFGEASFVEFLDTCLERHRKVQSIQRMMWTGQFQQGMREIQLLIATIMKDVSNQMAQVREKDMADLLK